MKDNTYRTGLQKLTLLLVFALMSLQLLCRGFSNRTEEASPRKVSSCGELDAQNFKGNQDELFFLDGSRVVTGWIRPSEYQVVVTRPLASIPVPKTAETPEEKERYIQNALFVEAMKRIRDEIVREREGKQVHGIDCTDQDSMIRFMRTVRDNLEKACGFVSAGTRVSAVFTVKYPGLNTIIIDKKDCEVY